MIDKNQVIKDVANFPILLLTRINSDGRIRPSLMNIKNVLAYLQEKV
jgi:hypothetical protein